MINNEIVAYIKDLQAKGTPKDAIEKNLSVGGWSATDVSEAFAFINNTNAPVPTSTSMSTPTPLPTSMPTSSPTPSLIPPQPQVITPHVTLPPRKSFNFHPKLSILIILILIFIVGTAYAYVEKVGPFSVAPYNEQNLFSGILAKSGTINTSAYSISLSLNVGARDPGVTPLPSQITHIQLPTVNAQGSTTFEGTPPNSIVPARPFLADLSDAIRKLPNQFEMDGTFSGKGEWKTPGLPDSTFNIDANGNFGDLQYKVNVDFLKKGEDFYFKVNNIPSIFLGSFSEYKGVWIKISPSQNGSTSPLSFVAEFEKSYKETQAQNSNLVAKATQFADEEKLVSLKNLPTRETIDNQTLYRYDLKLNKGALLPFSQKFLAEAKNDKGADASFTDALQRMVDGINSDQFDTNFDFFQNNFSVSIWIDKEGYVAMEQFKLRLVPPDDATQLKDKQVNIILTIKISDINQPVIIEAPADAKNIDEISGGALSEDKDKEIILDAN